MADQKVRVKHSSRRNKKMLVRPEKHEKVSVLGKGDIAAETKKTTRVGPKKRKGLPTMAEIKAEASRRREAKRQERLRKEGKK
jgi:hypothetical protein